MNSTPLTSRRHAYLHNRAGIPPFRAEHPPANNRNLRLRIPPLAVVALAGGLAWITARIVPAWSFEFAAQAGLTATFVLLGITCSLLGVASFRLARTTVNPMTPHASTALVVSGIYRVTRNPMYLGFLFLLLAQIVWLANPVALLVAPAFVVYLNRFQIVPEEIALRNRFGAEFNAYAAHVRRWI
jgi:protein-S-isoprenylcysteine O-methyltransferase Ste14